MKLIKRKQLIIVIQMAMELERIFGFPLDTLRHEGLNQKSPLKYSIILDLNLLGHTNKTITAWIIL